jgi:polar amino acid transport system permease protein
MSVAAVAPPRDQVADAEVQATSRQQFRFVAWTAVVWIGILILIVAFFSFIHLDLSFMLKWLPFIAEGVATTLFVSVASILLACVIALIGALGRLSRNPLFFGPATFYVSIIRGTPLMVQILIWYLALPQVRIPVVLPEGLVLEPMLAGIFALAVCYGAYMTETFRAGIQSISKGQTEAAMALGMTRSQTMRRIVLPQAFRVIIPPIGNDFIAMTKDSSLVYVMGVWEILFRASKIGRQYFRNFETLVIAALFYWIMQIILQYFQSKLEARMARGER